MSEHEQLIHKDIADNLDVVNIELGSGCGDFGAKFYADCFLTDYKAISVLKKECTTCNVTINCDAHFIPSNSNRFTRVIMCNPYGYGFNNNDMSKQLLDELYRVANNEAEILILTTSSNKYSAPQRVEKRVKSYNKINNIDRFTYNYTEIDSEVLYPSYIFYNTDASKRTFPNHQIILKCHKP